MPYLTPNSEGTVKVKTLNVPFEFLPAVNGALLELTFPENWEKFGTLTPDQCADAMFTMFDDYQQS